MILRHSAFAWGCACACALGTGPGVAAGPAAAKYDVELVRVSPPKLAVTAELSIDGGSLTMDTTRPGDIPELDAGGWPSLVANLRVSDTSGRAIGVTKVGAAGWELSRPHTGRLNLSYEVDYGGLAQRGWPAPREAAFEDAENVVLVGRSMFVTTPAVAGAAVRLDAPAGWRAVTAWPSKPESAGVFLVASGAELVENLVVFSRSEPDVVSAGGFRVSIVAMGHWQPSRHEVRRVLGAVVPRLVALMGFDEREHYLVVLLPMMDRGARRFGRASR